MSKATNHETLRAIIDHIDDHSYPPTVRELGRVLGLAPATVHDRLKALEDAGHIYRVGKRKVIVVKENA